MECNCTNVERCTPCTLQAMPTFAPAPKVCIVIGYVLRGPNGKMLRWSDEVGDYFATEMQPDLFTTESQAFRVLGNAIAHCAQDEQDGFVNPVAQEMIEWLLTCKVTRLIAG